MTFSSFSSWAGSSFDSSVTVGAGSGSGAGGGLSDFFLFSSLFGSWVHLVFRLIPQ